MAAASTANIPKWMVSGGWFDVCKCNIPCPCEFAQTPTFGDCDVVLVYHIHKGQYGETPLDGLNVLALGSCSIYLPSTKLIELFHKIMVICNANGSHRDKSGYDENYDNSVDTNLQLKA